MVLVGLDRDRAASALTRLAPDAPGDQRPARCRADRGRRRAAGRRRGTDHGHPRGRGGRGVTERRHVCFVTANTFEYDSRTLRAAQALAADGHRSPSSRSRAPACPRRRRLADGIRLVRPALDRRVSSAFRPLPSVARRVLARVLGFDAEAVTLPPRGRGLVERVRGPLRRAAEILAYRRRVGPWAAAAAAAAPDADVFSAKALVALPVIREAAVTDGGPVRLRHRRPARRVRAARRGCPARSSRTCYGRERAWMREAAALTTVTEPMADEVARRFGVARPTVVMNCRPRWRPDEAMPTTPPPARGDRARRRRAGRPDPPVPGRVPGGPGHRGAAGGAGRRPAARRAVRRRVPGLRPARSATAGPRPPCRRAGSSVLPPVPSEELLEWTAGADLAFVGAPPKTINLGLTIPNKLFESLMAGVPVVVAGGTAVARLVAERRAGVVVDAVVRGVPRRGPGRSADGPARRTAPPSDGGPAPRHSSATTGRPSSAGWSPCIGACLGADPRRRPSDDRPGDRPTAQRGPAPQQPVHGRFAILEARHQPDRCRLHGHRGRPPGRRPAVRRSTRRLSGRPGRPAADALLAAGAGAPATRVRVAETPATTSSGRPAIGSATRSAGRTGRSVPAPRQGLGEGDRRGRRPRTGRRLAIGRARHAAGRAPAPLGTRRQGHLRLTGHPSRECPLRPAARAVARVAGRPRATVGPGCRRGRDRQPALRRAPASGPSAAR